MNKLTKTIFQGNPRVEGRLTKDGTKYNLRLVYYIGNGNRKCDSLNLSLYAKPRTAEQREYNRQQTEVAKRVREGREKEFLSAQKGYIFEVDREKVNMYEWFEGFIVEYSKHHKGGRKFASALGRFKEYIKQCKEYSKYFAEQINPTQINERMVAGYVRYLVGISKGSGAITTYRVFRQMLTEATKQRLFTINPCDNVKPPMEGKGICKEVLTRDEVVRLIQCRYEGQNEVIRTAFILSLYTGLRYCDIKMLKYGNIDLDNLTITIVQSKTQYKLTNPLRADVAEMLGCGKDNELVFPNLPTNEGCNHSLKTWAGKAGITKHITWHCARHTTATLTLESCKDVVATKELLGHRKLENTMVYSRVMDERKRELVDSLPGLPTTAAIQAQAAPGGTYDSMTTEQLKAQIEILQRVLAGRK